MRVIIAGGRDFNDYEYLAESCAALLSVYTVSCVVSGGATGADLLGERFAKANGWPVKRFLPDWKKFGKKAGPVRNAEMAANADFLIAFWDGVSRGTNSMIALARASGLPVHVFNV